MPQIKQHKQSVSQDIVIFVCHRWRHPVSHQIGRSPARLQFELTESQDLHEQSEGGVHGAKLGTPWDTSLIRLTCLMTAYDSLEHLELYTSVQAFESKNIKEWWRHVFGGIEELGVACDFVPPQLGMSTHQICSEARETFWAEFPASCDSANCTNPWAVELPAPIAAKWRVKAQHSVINTQSESISTRSLSSWISHWTRINALQLQDFC